MDPRTLLPPSATTQSNLTCWLPGGNIMLGPFVLNRMRQWNFVDNFSGMKLASPGTPMYPTIWSGFAPRLGMAFRLRDKAGWETVLRGGYGIFYDLGSGASGVSLTQFPFSRSRANSNVPFPLDPAATAIQLPAPLSMNPPFADQYFTAFDLRYALPRTHQWSLGVNPSIGRDQALTLSYIGNAGRRLLRRYAYRFPTGTSSINRENPHKMVWRVLQDWAFSESIMASFTLFLFQPFGDFTG